MLQADAKRLLTALAAVPDRSFPHRVMPGETATALGLSPGRAWRALRLLCSRGYYEYDISAYSGRLTAAGRQAAKELSE